MHRPQTLPARVLSQTESFEELAESTQTYVKHELLLRGFAILDANPANTKDEISPVNVLSSLQKSNFLYPAGLSPRFTVFDHDGGGLFTIAGKQPRKETHVPDVFRSTSMPSWQTISPHVEMAAMKEYQVPDVVAFHAIGPNDGIVMAETPLVDMRKAFTKLPVALQDKLRKTSITYSYTYRIETKWYHKIWDCVMKWMWGRSPRSLTEAFDLSTVEEVKKACAIHELQFRVRGNWAEVSSTVPALFTKEGSTTLMWCGDFWSRQAFTFDRAFFRERLEKENSWFFNKICDIKYSLAAACPRLFYPEEMRAWSENLSEDDVNQIFNVLYDEDVYMMFPWKRDRVVIIDNKHFGHARALCGDKILTATYGRYPRFQSTIRKIHPSLKELEISPPSRVHSI